MASTRFRRSPRRRMKVVLLVIFGALLVVLVCGYLALGARGGITGSGSAESAGGGGGLASPIEPLPWTGGASSPPLPDGGDANLGVSSGAGSLGGLALSAPSSTSVREVDLGVVEAAREVLDEYRSQGEVVLAHAGWIDLLGRTWGCVVRGPSWSELCLVCEAGEGSRVTTVRMEVAEWRDSHAEAATEGEAETEEAPREGEESGSETGGAAQERP